MAQRMQSLSTLKRRYPKEWLLLTNVVADELTRPIKGKLVAHSETRDNVYVRLGQIRSKSLCIEYTGDMPKDLIIVFSGYPGRITRSSDFPSKRWHRNTCGVRDS